MRRWTFLAALALTVGLATGAHALYRNWGQWAPGHDISASFWPKGADKLANRQERFDGHMLNSFDHFLFHGNTAALNAFLGDLAGVQGSRRVMFLSADQRIGLIDPRAEGADWTMSISANSHVGVFLPAGGPFKLADLKIPADVPVESYGEVGAAVKEFVQQHEKARTAAPQR